MTNGPLIDYSRNDINASTPTPRALMLSVFQPAKCASTVYVPYMPNKTAEHQGPYLQSQFDISENLSPLFQQARLPVCPEDFGGCSTVDEGRILLFSPGVFAPRLFYSVVASAIASEGFTVISIDHPEDANIIEYPDGHTVYHNATPNPTREELISYIYPRVADVSFIIDQLSNATAMAELLPHRGARPFPTDRVAMLGHSMGGIAAVVAASQEPRLRGAINWDQGLLFVDLPPSGVSQPVMYVTQPNATDPTGWERLNGPKLWVEVANTTHMSYTDALVLLQGAGQNTTALADMLGTIEPAELVKILVAYTAEWMNGAFAGEVGGSLLQGGEPDRFPEVSVVKKSNY
ncbi:hypothetical protein BU23DRAFT_559506 [Bimuria novae-zelandiae CBS 107.79]|uniref:1-alkyl-2-acetylglycerophosphocholine esterase n=1 Tax=Bimuria novae-zelandiae CBS 107.79 TaxID=1447943 RepID=A0A6A5UU95_9PLEO|nr:hypothetical protein BU23DRAFT_559506 [Bimuria novae-zelandiae CBS 107.79]